jgi:hypothetical protein
MENLEVSVMTEAATRSTRPWTRWSDWAEVVLGVLAALSPLVFDHTTKVGWTLVILGALIALDGLWSLAAPGLMASEGIEIVLGVLLFISPWVMSYTSMHGAMWTSWIIGLLTVVAGALSAPMANVTHRLTGQH